MASNNAKDTHNKSSKEKHMAAASMLAFKLKQETKLKSALEPHFKQVGNQVKKAYANTGKLPSFDAHRKAVKTIINDHYIDTATKTSTNLRDNFKPVPNDDKLQALIDTQIENDADDRSDFAADSIANTTKDNFKRYIKNATVERALKDNSSSNEKNLFTQIETKKSKETSKIIDKIEDVDVEDLDEDIGEDILRMFYEELEDRLDLISQMETSAAANDGIVDEMDALEDTEAEFEDGTTIDDYKGRKTWVAIMDDRTRPEHAEADGQEVDYAEPFEVGGEELMQPGDDSLGASDWNLMGCRCEAVISLE
jgi:hypothetical protein